LLALRLLLAVALIFGVTPANAATNPSPAPKKSVPATKKPVVKKPATKKPVVKKPATKQPVVKKPVKKKPVQKKPVKKKIRKTAKPIPIPKAVWPPKGFKQSNGIYYSSPKSEKELIELITTKSVMATAALNCKEFVCAVIRVAAKEKCSAWQFTSKVIAYNGEQLGDLISLRKGSKGKVVATYFLISKEALENNSEITRIITTCIRGPVVGKIPSDEFIPATPITTNVETQTPAAQ